MPTIDDIKKYMKVWKQYTYCSGLECCYLIKEDKRTYNLTADVLKLQGLDTKTMDGNSVCGIPLKNEGKVDIIFTDIFWDSVGYYITPVYYVASIVKKCLERRMGNPQQVADIVGRGLRALPSFFREMDLKDKLSLVFPNAEITNNPKQDVGEHTDIFIKTDNKEYRLWSYQNTGRGLSNTAVRFRGKRGELPEGYHVLCPIDIKNKTEVEEVYGWYFYSEQYVRDIYAMISRKKPDEYDSLARLQAYAMKLYLKKANIVHK